MEYFSVLEKMPLFTGLTPAELKTLLHCFGTLPQRTEKGQTLLLEGQPAQLVGIVLAGQAQVQRQDYFGNRSIVAVVEPGELFGEAFACAGTASLPVRVVASAPGTVLFLDCRKLLSPCEKGCGFHRRLSRNLLQVVSQKNVLLSQKIDFLTRRTTREKLLAYLSAQAQQTGSRRFSIALDRQELADFLAVDRSGLSAEIGRLRREGVLECSRNHFVLLRSGGTSLFDE